MARIAVLGEAILVQPFALAGAMVCIAETPATVLDAWRALPSDVAIVVLTPAAAAALSGHDEVETRSVLSVVLP